MAKKKGLGAKIAAIAGIAAAPFTGGASLAAAAPFLLNRKTYKDEQAAEDKMSQTEAKEQAVLIALNQRQKRAKKELDDLIANFPELASNEDLIADMEANIQSNISDTEQGIQDYETQGAANISKLEKDLGLAKSDLARSEQEARTGIEAGLDRYKNLAKRTTLPGQQAIKDSLMESTATGTEAIKRLAGSGGGLNSITELLKNQALQEKSLGIEAANYRDQNQRQLAGAEMSAGTTMADIIRGNAVSGANISERSYAAHTDFLNNLASQKTNLAETKTNIAQSMYGVKGQDRMSQYQYNELAPAQMKANFAQNRYNQNNPASAYMDILGRDYGMAYSDKMTAEQQRQANNQMLVKTTTDLFKFFAGGAGG